MKKYQYVVAITCLALGAMGFTGLYMTNQIEEEKGENHNIVQESEDLILGSQILEKEETETEDQMAVIDEKEDVTDVEPNHDPDAFDTMSEEAPVGTITQEALHFNPDDGIVWPIEGTVLLDYCMDATIFFPTLQQYQYNPAMVLSGNVNDKVYFVARGKITNIETNEETGITVTQDLGDGYTAVYGQLKELNFELGEIVESGQVVGYVNEPTKYYSVEGSNVYFQVLKDGKPIDPEDILP